MTILITIILFIIVLGILVFSHELGHFSIAKLFKIKVEEFGFGFPPKIWGFKRGETEYSLNWIPFGGFVRIFGEDNEVAISDEDKKRSFVHKPKLVQIAVLIAGIVFNIVLAWILVSIVVASGVPASAGSVDLKYLEDIDLMVVSVVPNSPASAAGLLPGYDLVFIKHEGNEYRDLNIENFNERVAEIGENEFILGVQKQNGELEEISLSARKGIWKEDTDKLAIGIGLDMVGIAKVPLYIAPITGAKLTWQLTKVTVIGYATIIADLFKGNGGEVLAMISGPLGIAGLVGSAFEVGFSSLLMLTAIISISLAIINILPFPALDGGRILFVLIEAIKGSPIKSNIVAIINSIGFFILIALLFVVTFSDIAKLFT